MELYNQIFSSFGNWLGTFIFLIFILNFIRNLAKTKQQSKVILKHGYRKKTKTVEKPLQANKNK